ncbi:MAG: methyltransferase domain-containing protein [Nocardioides sp.]|nr:methyltransferase domain-containing protein [Nocardioides sp.]
MSTSPEVQARLDEYWSGRAPEYDAYQQRPERAALDRAEWGAAFSAALPPAPADVLDVGTGSGYVAFLLASLGHRVTATDHAEGMLSIARTRAEDLRRRGELAPTIVAGDAVAPDFPEASFDAITSRYLLWTLREPDAALQDWRRLLRPGGVLIAVDSTWFPDGIDPAATDGAHGDDEGAFARAYHSGVRAALPLAEARSIDAAADRVRAAGFRDVTVTPLEAIHALDLEHGVAPGHEVQMQYLVRGRA